MNNRQIQSGLWRYLTTVHVPGFPKLSTQISDLSDKSSNNEVDDLENGDEHDLDQEEDEDEDFDS